MTIATIEIAAKRRIAWENRAAVLINGVAGSMNVFDGQVTAKVGFSPVAWVLGKLRLPTDLLDIKLVDVTIPGASKYRSPNPDELTVSVNGQPDDAAGLGTPVGGNPATRCASSPPARCSPRRS